MILLSEIQVLGSGLILSIESDGIEPILTHLFTATEQTIKR
ncbi:MAG: hypothetical protein P4L41_18005 [Flavipsychrobacter sp.]|nr:hypothetical protein [Flavipsychrobacter sp.]